LEEREMRGGLLVVGRSNLEALIRKRRTTTRDTFKLGPFKDLILDLLHKDPRRRPSNRDIKSRLEGVVNGVGTSSSLTSSALRPFSGLRAKLSHMSSKFAPPIEVKEMAVEEGGGGGGGLGGGSSGSAPLFINRYRGVLETGPAPEPFNPVVLMDHHHPPVQTATTPVVVQPQAT